MTLIRYHLDEEFSAIKAALICECFAHYISGLSYLPFRQSCSLSPYSSVLVFFFSFFFQMSVPFSPVLCLSLAISHIALACLCNPLLFFSLLL